MRSTIWDAPADRRFARRPRRIAGARAGKERAATGDTRHVDPIGAEGEVPALALEDLDLALLVLDRALRVRAVTPAARAALLLAPGEPLARAAIFEDDAREVLRTLATIERDEVDASGRWRTRRVSPHRAADGAVDGVLVLLLDAERAKRAELALLAARAEVRAVRDAAEAARSEQDRSLSMISHELRTPLNPIVLAIDELARGPDVSPEVRAGLESMRRNVAIEMRLVDDLLDLVRATHDRLELARARVDAVELLRAAADVCRAQSQGKHQRIVVEDPGSPRIVDVDPVRIEQALWNLVRNAIRYSGEGATIRLRCEEHANEIALEVVDEGEGIAPEQLERIFEAFVQGPRARAGGLGLGLAVARAFAHAHGGRIEAESAGVGRGATFRIVLPRNAPPGARRDEHASVRPVAGEPAAAGAAGSAGALLLVDDHRESARLLARALATRGFWVEVAGDVAGARRRLEARRFDALISDLTLPDGDGVELMADAARRGIPGVAISGLGAPSDVERAKAGGFANHLLKPVRVDELCASLGRLLGARGAP